MWDRTQQLAVHDAVQEEVRRIHHARGSGSGAPLREVVAESWKRCLADYNLDPDRVPRAAVLTHAEMRELEQQHEDLLKIAGSEVERLFRRLVDSEYLVSFASPRGVMMLFRCDYQFLGDMSNFGVLPGSVWDEERQGTNGVGTSLRLGRSVAISGQEHYGTSTQGLRCVTSPVFGASGAVEGVINATAYCRGKSGMDRVVSDIVERTARRIEGRYFMHVHRDKRLLRIAADMDSADLAEQAHVALTDDGHIAACTSHVGLLAGIQTESLIGRRAEDMLEAEFDFCDVRPDAVFDLEVKGRRLQAMLCGSQRRPLREARPQNAHWRPVATTDSAAPAQLLGAASDALVDRGRRLFEAGLPLIVIGETGSGKSHFIQMVTRGNSSPASELIVFDCGLLNGGDAFRAMRQLAVARPETGLVLERIEELDDRGQAELQSLLDHDPHRSVRVIASTTNSLEAIRREARPRSELLHRLKGGSIVLPPLRALPDLGRVLDQVMLAACRRQCRETLQFSDIAKSVLMNYHWPGNMRELLHAMGHALALSDGPMIGLEHLPDDIVAEMARDDITARSQSEASRIEAALRHNNGNISLTARYLGVSRATLYRKIDINRARLEVALNRAGSVGGFNSQVE